MSYKRKFSLAIPERRCSLILFLMISMLIPTNRLRAANCCQFANGCLSGPNVNQQVCTQQGGTFYAIGDCSTTNPPVCFAYARAIKAPGVSKEALIGLLMLIGCIGVFELRRRKAKNQH